MFEHASVVPVISLDPTHPVVRFQRTFATLAPGQALPLEDLYTSDIVFDDPLRHIEGLDQLRRYLSGLYARLIKGQFILTTALVGEQAAFLPWTLQMEVRRIRRPIVVPGCSYLVFAEKIYQERDYYDAGTMIYEHVPLMGAIVRAIKARV